MRVAPVGGLVLLLLAPALAGCLALVRPPEPAPLAAPPDPADLGPTTYSSVGANAVRIHRDAFGVPHIYADTEEALLWGQGYAMAEDRLFQMELFRRSAKGRLAEILGEALLPADIATRRVTSSEAERWDLYAALGDRDREALAAFGDGVTYAMARALADPARLPIEFVGLGDPPKPWEVTDTLAILEMVFAQYGVFGGHELENARLLADLERKLGPEEARKAFDDLVPVADPEAPVSIAPQDLAYPTPEVPAEVPLAQRALLTAAVLEAGARADAERATAKALLARVGLNGGWGSNAILVSGSLSASGNALLVGGPQVGHAVPPFFWEVGLHGAGFDAEGVTVAGVPGIPVGRSQTAAWTVTSGYSDTVDLFVDDASSAGSLQHRVETFFVGGTSGVPRVEVVDLYRARHGPVLAFTTDHRQAIALARAVAPQDSPGVFCWMRLGTLHSYPEVAECAARVPVNFNLFYADITGVVAHHHMGKVPLRAPGLDVRLPLPGDGSADWLGFVPPAQMPHVRDPTPGWLVNWNNMPARNWPSGDQPRLWGPADRVQGLERTVGEALAAKGKLTTRDLVQALEQAATRSLFAPRYEAFLRAAAPGPARDAMLDWIGRGAPVRDDDGDGFIDHPGVGAFEAFHANLSRLLLAQPLGDAFLEPVYAKAYSGNSDLHGALTHEHSLLLRALAGHTRHSFADEPGVVVAEALAQAEAALGQPAAMPQHVFQSLGSGKVAPIPRMNRGSYHEVVELSVPMRFTNLVVPGERGLRSVAGVAGLVEDPPLDDQRNLYLGFGAKAPPFTLARVLAAAAGTEDLQVVRGVVFPETLPQGIVDLLDQAGVPRLGLLGDLGT